MMRKEKEFIYKEPETMLKKPKGYKRDSDNLPDMKKVKQYYSQKKGR